MQLSPTTAVINQALDLTVKALDANGNVVKEYAGDIFIDLTSASVSVDSQDYSLPSDGIYTFLPSDQGVKTFSKGLVVKKAGTYSVKVSEIINESIKGESALVIKGDDDTGALGIISISSPTPDSIETNKTINVVGNSSLKNSPLQLYINGIKVKDELTSTNGDFNVYINDIKPGSNTLQAKITDAQGSEAAKSDEINFTYKPAEALVVSGFEILPGNTVKQGQKVTFIFHTNDAKSVNLSLISDDAKAQKIVLESADATTWRKEYLMDKAGMFTVDAVVNANGVDKPYDNIGRVNVVDAKSVQEIKYFIDNIDKTNLHLSWTYLGNYLEGEIPYFSIQYAREKGDVSAAQGIVVSGASTILTGMDFSQPYYLQITPSDLLGKQIGEPSDIVMIEATKGSAPVCRVEGIRVLQRKIADQYYLTWDKVDGADRYIIYRSDTPVDPNGGIAGMQKVGETADSKFAYPYDVNAPRDTYAYYAVVAICSDGSALQLDSTQKVKVGPMQNILFMLLISGLLFGLYKLNIVARRR